MKTTLSETFLTQAFRELEEANRRFLGHYPGDRGDRQPIHTLYGGAQLYRAETTEKIGELARKHFAEYAPDAKALKQAVEGKGSEALWKTIYTRVTDRLQVCAVEDFRIDFEDGYGNRPDAEEDQTAAFAAGEVAKALRDKKLPPFIGIRIKPFTNELKRRGARTLDLFLSTLLEATGGALPAHFVITLPKVSIPEQTTAFIRLLEQMETAHRLPAGTLKIEIMVETSQAIIGRDGVIPLPAIFAAAQGRCRGAHFGTYDYTASCDITAAHQRMDHPVCDYALFTLKNALAGTGIWLSDGATSIMPVPLHKAPEGKKLSAKQKKENRDSVHQAWRTSFGHIQHSLVNGYYQGWDLHPGQLAIRYAAGYAFFLEGLPQASARLKNFMEKAAQATLVGDVFDDAATGQGLLNYFLRALSSGAITEKEIQATGMTLAEVRTKSFAAILKGRRKV